MYSAARKNTAHSVSSSHSPSGAQAASGSGLPATAQLKRSIDASPYVAAQRKKKEEMHGGPAQKKKKEELGHK